MMGALLLPSQDLAHPPEGSPHKLTSRVFRLLSKGPLPDPHRTNTMAPAFEKKKKKNRTKKPTLLLESALGRRKEARWFQHQISLGNGSFAFTRVPVFRFGSVTGPLVPWGWERQLRSHKCYSCVVSGAHTYHLGVV